MDAREGVGKRDTLSLTTNQKGPRSNRGVGLSAPVSGPNVSGVYLHPWRVGCARVAAGIRRKLSRSGKYTAEKLKGGSDCPRPLCVTWHYTRKRFPPPASASAGDRPRFFVAGFCSGPTDRRPCCRCHDLPGFPRLVAFDFPLVPLHLYLTHAIQRDYEPAQGVFGSLVDGAGVSKPQLVRETLGPARRGVYIHRVQ